MSGIFIFFNDKEVDQSIYEEINKYVPCELFFAISNSIKYVMVVYVAKWIKKSSLIGLVGFMFVLLGVFTCLKFFILANTGITLLTYTAYVHVISGSVLFVTSSFLFLFCSMDPLDSDLIINEQCMNLTATYNLPQVKDVMLRSELEAVVKN